MNNEYDTDSDNLFHAFGKKMNDEYDDDKHII